jgi:hypothetical protein
MVLSALFAMVVLVAMGFQEDELFLLVAVLNVLVIGSILLLEPEFVTSFRRWLKISRRSMS